MILDSIYPSTGGGGAESQVTTLTQWLAGQGIPSTIVVPMVAYGPQVPYETTGPVEITRLRYPHLPVLGGMMLMAKLAWLLFIRRHDIQAIHCHIAKNMAVVATLANRWLKRPLLVKLTGMTETVGGILDHKAPLPTRLKRRILQQAQIQSISQAISNRLLEAGFSERRIQYIPNAVDLDRYDPSLPRFAHARERQSDDIALRAVFVGRLEAVKGIELLLDAWNRTFRPTDPVRLTLIGAGSLEQSLRERIASGQRSHQIVIHGQSADVAGHLATADIGILPSYTEGLSNTLLESMAMGLPMIGSRISGNEDFIQPHVTGWLFPAGDTEALARCLSDAYRLSREQLASMGANARAFVHSQASVPIIGERLRQIYGLSRTHTGKSRSAPGHRGKQRSAH